MPSSKEILKVTQPLTVLFVEDYTPLREEMGGVLQNYFLHVESAIDGVDALAKYKEYYKKHKKYYDIVLTDIKMPRMDGVELIKAIRRINKEQQVIVLSAHQESEYLLELINLGIKRYIAKPLVYKEFLQVLYSVAKELTLPSEEVVTTVYLDKGYEFDILSNTLKNGEGEAISLTKNEIATLHLLATNVDKVCSSQEIIDSFESVGANIQPENIRNMISKLRKKLPSGVLESIYGVGYKINSISL